MRLISTTTAVATAGVLALATQGHSAALPSDTAASYDDSGVEYPTWGADVNIRSEPTTGSDVVTTLPEPTTVTVACQVQGETVSAEGYVNDWWSYVPELGGYLTNIYLDTPEAQLTGVPICDSAGLETESLDPEALDSEASDLEWLDPGALESIDPELLEEVLPDPSDQDPLATESLEEVPVEDDPGPDPDSDVCRPVVDGDASDWQELISFRPSNEVQQMVRDRSSWLIDSDVHPIENGWGSLNLDCYEVVIDQLPVVDGEQWSAEQLLTYMRQNFNEFIDTDLANFESYDDADADRFAASDPLGSVLHIDMRMGSEYANPDDGSVVLSDLTSDHWTFSTVRMPADLDHPVSGNRQWGFVEAADGTYRFFTRGADRPTFLLDYAGEDLIFDSADALWTSFQSGLAEWVNTHDGTAYVGTVESERHDWDAMVGYHQPSHPWLDELWLAD